MSYQTDLNALLSKLENNLKNAPIHKRYYLMERAKKDISNNLNSLFNDIGVTTSKEIKEIKSTEPNYIDVHINTNIANIMIDSVINGVKPIDVLDDYANKNNKPSGWVKKAKVKPLHIDLVKQLYKKDISIELNKYGLLGFYNQPKRWTINSFLKQLKNKIEIMEKTKEMEYMIKVKNKKIIELSNEIKNQSKKIKNETICCKNETNWKEKAIELKVNNNKIRYQEIAFQIGMSLSSVKKFMSQKETKEKIKRVKSILDT